MQPEDSRFRRFMAAAGKNTGLLVIVLISIGVGFLLHAALAPVRPAPGPAASGQPAAPAGPTEWTCSMHPQVRRSEPGRCPICSMDLIPVSQAGDDARSLREFTTSEAARALMDIETSPVERKLVTAHIRMVGKIDYDETRLAYISAWVPGRLDRLYVDYTGVPVKEGDHLVYIYSPELLSAQEELLQARQALQNSEGGILGDTAEATYQAAREKLRLLGLTAEQIDAVERSGKPSDHLTINSPVAGIVIHKNAKEGMYVNTGTRIYTVADLSRMWVRLDAYESDLMWLRYGQPVEFTTVSYPGETFEGTISFIDPVLDPATRTVKVRVNVPNPEGKLKPGMFVKAVVHSEVAAGGKVVDADLAGKWISPMHPEIIEDEPGTCDVCGMPLVRTESLGYVSLDPAEAEKPLVIPATAPLITGTRAVVYVEVPDADKPTYEGREVVLGPRAGDYYLVRSGLEEGQRVVTRGNFKIDSALQISARPSMMSPEGSAGSAPKSPPVFAYQVRLVLDAAEDAARAISAGRRSGEIHAAFAELGARVEAVDDQSLQGDTALIWREYSMRLSNDAAAGQQADTPRDFARVAESVRDNAEGLRSGLGLAPDEAEVAQVDARFLAQIREVYQAYFAAREALTADDLDAAQGAAAEAQAALSRVDMALVSGQDHTAWMEASRSLREILDTLTAAGTIEQARSAFALYSEAMTALAGRFGSPTGGPLYEIQCPMAFNNRGAIWLQRDSEVKNPYYGDIMLRCGTVQQVFAAPKPDASPPPATQPAPQAKVWTCPMHPDVRRDEPGECPTCSMALVPVSPGAEAHRHE